MLRIYRATVDFEAAELRTDPTRIAIFHPGDLLLVINNDDSYTTFCRHEESVDVLTCPQFLITSAEFEISTEISS